MSDLTFQQWMQQVDRELVSRCGLTHRDLADFKFHDAYADECDPTEVAVEVLQENNFPFGD